MDHPDWAPLDSDLNTPSVARIYDFYLGGSHNFEVDRQVAREAVLHWPRLAALARDNRAFLRRAVRFLLGKGITQFIDIGSGIPAAGNVHEVALAINPRARVVYVDCDPVTVAHSRVILASNPQALVLQADLRRPGDIVQNAEISEFIDFGRPIGLILAAVLHLVGNADAPAAIVAALADEVVAGSYLAISHPAIIDDPKWATIQEKLVELYRQTPMPITMRTPDEIRRLFGPFELVDPGLVRVTRWRPDHGVEDAAEDIGYAGVGRKPHRSAFERGFTGAVG